MKDPRDWNEEDILNLPIGEFDWLEIKGRSGLDLSIPTIRESHVRENLSKALSAFANSGGGILLLGMRDPKTSQAVDDGGINLFFRKPTGREWLETAIPNLVDPPLTTFNVYVITKQSDRSHIGDERGVFVIEIKDSIQAPHQAIDNRYYARVGGRSQPLGHRHVMDIFNRRQHPHIELDLLFHSRAVRRKVRSGDPSPAQSELLFETLLKEGTLLATARNVGRVYAQYLNVDIYLPKPLVLDQRIGKLFGDTRKWKTIDGIEYGVWQVKNTTRDLVRLGESEVSTEYGPSWYEPLLPGQSRAWACPVAGHFGLEDVEAPRILWEVYADNAPMRSGSISVEDVPVHKK